MQGLMMDYQLNVPAILRRAEQVFGDVPIVSRLPDRSFHRMTNADLASRARRLGVALRALGLEDGDRVATMMWNHHEHLEVYVGAPGAGFVTHTLNLRLHVDDNAYITNHAGDRVLVVDKVLWPLAEPLVPRAPFEHVIAVGHGETPPGTIDYEELLAAADESAFVERDIDERAAAGMCFTSGTTGPPEGRRLHHRAIALHALTMVAVTHMTSADVVLPVVPMFHANAWCFPFQCPLSGATQVFPGPHLDPVSLLEAFVSRARHDRGRRPDDLDRDPAGARRVAGRLGPLRDARDARRRRRGAARDDRGVPGATRAPRHARLGHDRDVARRDDVRGARPGSGAGDGAHSRARRSRSSRSARVAPRASSPGTAESLGELEVRGAAIASSYYEAPEAADRWTEDGWFRTGDIVTIGSDGYVTVQDRAKDLIKSGGEWISSVALENELMGHPAVAEAAVIAMPDERWSERPLAVVVLREGQSATPEELTAFLEPRVARFWLPERYEFVEEIPKTAVGKFRKTALRERFVAAG